MEEFRFGIRRSLFNYNLKAARIAKGLTMQELADLVGCTIATLYSLQAFRHFPSGKLQEKISIALEVPIDSLWPEELQHFRIKRQLGLSDMATITLTEAKSMKLLEPIALLEAGDWEEEVERRADAHLVHEALDSLTPREKTVLTLRFGLDGGPSRTLEEVAKRFRVTRTRIQQIESKALRRLRHPTRSKYLKELLE